VRILLPVLVGALVVAGLAVALLTFQGRDDAGVSQATGPGVQQPDKGDAHLGQGKHISLKGLSDPPTSGPHHDLLVTRDRRQLDPNAIIHALELGDVILFYGARKPPPALVKLQDDVSGPFDAEVAAAGQQVILARRPGSGAAVGAAWRHLLHVDSPGDPKLREFAEAWLGRGAPGR
jgi:Protein of unknown function (DUF3105)